MYQHLTGRKEVVVGCDPRGGDSASVGRSQHGTAIDWIGRIKSDRGGRFSAQRTFRIPLWLL